ncbi:MAG: hypothetical protein Q9163_003155 [Psora crenata]
MRLILLLLGRILCTLLDGWNLWQSLRKEPVTPATDESHQPCGNCSQAGLSCTYDAIPQKKGPKGSRAKVISELKDTQKPPDQPQTQDGIPGYRSPPGSPTYGPTPGLLTPELIDACAESFFVQLYPSMPILHREQLNNVVREAGYSAESYCLLASLCSFMLIQPGIGSEELSVSITDPKMGTALMEEARRVRKGYDYIENPTVPTVITSFFLFSSCFALNRQNVAWFHLREATALSQLLGMQDESTYLFGNVVENARKRRVFWLLFVTERAYALQKHRPLTLHATIHLPTLDDDSSISLTGFIHLVNLYRPFDDTFIGLWNKSRTDCSTSWLSQLQQQLAAALPGYLNTTENQAADLRTTQQWLRTMVWQLSIMNGYLSSTSPDSSMTFRFPIEIARSLVAVTGGLTKGSLEVHGIGLVEKVFDVACTLVDVMSCVPSGPNNQPGPQEDLNRLLTLICSLRGGESRFLPLVMTKIRDTLPSIANKLPMALIRRAAAAGGLANSSGFGPVVGLNAVIEMNGFNGVNVKTGQEEGCIKQEPTKGVSGNLGASVNDAGSPYGTPPFMCYYPLV